jgi:hypothetical protein
MHCPMSLQKPCKYVFVLDANPANENKVLRPPEFSYNQV